MDKSSFKRNIHFIEQTIMVGWLKEYIDPQILSKEFPDDHSLELVAEATYWSVNLGLVDVFKYMSYADLRKFHHLEEMFRENTVRSLLIKRVSEHLVQPDWSHEASFALQQAAWLVYIKEKSHQTMKEVETLHNKNLYI